MLLLAVVAASHRSGISRDQLLALLWPDSDQEHARNALRQALHGLRRDLGLPDLLAGADPLRLDPRAITSDLREFEDALAAGRPAEAAKVYEGPFLDGVHTGGAGELDRWIEGRRLHYSTAAVGALEGLARDAEQRRDPAAAVGWWRRLTGLDPFNARGAVGLMEALVIAGDPAGALRHGRRFEAQLEDELGVPPDQAVLELIDRLQTVPLTTRLTGLRAVRERLAASAGRLVEDLGADLQGRYVIVRELERGRDGKVRLLLARDLRHERDVTIKIIHPALASVLDVDRFLREIKLTARLQHPHMLTLLDSGETGGQPWYAVPYVAGETLRTRLGREGRLEMDPALRIAVELAEALEHAHRHGVLHRDVSPENVLLAEGHALLTNLGVARALDAAAGPRLTETGMLVGTPAYMSPEQAAGSPALDARSDVYSLGCVVYEMLAGEPLYSGPTPQAIMAKRLAQHPPLDHHLPGVSEAIAAALSGALARRPADRVQSAAAFAAALAA